MNGENEKKKQFNAFIFLTLSIHTLRCFERNSLSSIRLDGLRFKFSRLIKNDYLLHALLLYIFMYSIVYFFLIAPFLFKKET